MKLTRACAVIIAFAVVGCGGTDATNPPECSMVSLSYNAASAPSVVTKPTRFDALFEAAAAEFAVSPELLKAVGYVETRWQMVEGRQEFEGRPAAFGVMALRGERLEQGALLAHVSAEEARRDPSANIRAAAALLAARGLAQFSGIDQPEARDAYVTAVHEAMGRPAPATRPRFSSLSADCPTPGSNVDYATAIWRPSPNFNARPADSTGAIHMIIIHTCEGNYAGCWGWLVNTASQVSSHYVVNENGSEVSQLVHEEDRAWQIAARYDCTLNAQHDCWLNNVQSNHFTIGIEHAGFAAQDSFPTAQLESSARLVCDITQRQGIPRDSLHILGHGQLQPANRTDPGPNWPWHRYIAMVRSYCGGS